jgi:5'-deoxynucleotidase YfbR-like HD superfamily hydrolase
MTAVEPVDPIIRLHSGRDFNFMEPRADDIDIKDIAHALSQVCRFAAQTSEFYSVAQHSHVVSVLISGGSGMRKWGLLHDASEAYIHDISRPLKRWLPDYQAIEERLMRAVADRFDLSWPMPTEVKTADNMALAVEAQRFMRGRIGEWGIGARWPSARGRSLVHKALDPTVAEAQFLETFMGLVGK